MLNSIKEIEDAMADAILDDSYTWIQKEYHRLLDIMGNVDGDEIIALLLVAHEQYCIHN